MAVLDSALGSIVSVSAALDPIVEVVASVMVQIVPKRRAMVRTAILAAAWARHVRTLEPKLAAATMR